MFLFELTSCAMRSSRLPFPAGLYKPEHAYPPIQSAVSIMLALLCLSLPFRFAPQIDSWAPPCVRSAGAAWGAARGAAPGRATGNDRMKTTALKKHLQYKVPQLRLALIRENDVKPSTIYCPSDIELFAEPLKYATEEYFIAFHLDAKHNVIGYTEVSHGTLSASLVHPREVFKAALLSNAHAILVAHNHPAGSLYPSKEDLETTQQLVAAGKILGVPVLDHIIVAYSGIRSIRENHPSLFE